MSAPLAGQAVAATRTDRALGLAVAALVVAQAAVVGLQVVGRHLLHRPIPWTEEVARLLLGWLMCVGGILALRHAQHPRVTAVVRLLSPLHRAAVDRGLRLVLLALFVALIGPSWTLTRASAAELLPASGLSGVWITAILPVALALMSLEVIRELWREGLTPWRARTSLTWALGTTGVIVGSVLVPLLAGASPLLVLVIGFLVTGALGLPLAFTLALTALTYLIGIGGVGLVILPIKILGGVDSFVLLAIPLFILAGALMETGGISERIVNLAMAIVGKVRGGLAMVVVVAEILFSGISGSTAADVSAISALLVPSMRRAGYSGPESVSIVAAASAMGILVPPCLTMVVLGSLVNLSIVTLFLAGFVPAFILAASLMVLIALRARRANWPVTGGASRRELGRVLLRALVPMGLPVLLFGGIFSGITTVTEAALIAVVYALVAGLLLGDVRRVEVTRQLTQSGVVTATTLWVLAAASAFAWILVREWVPQALAEWIGGAGAGRVGFMISTVVVFIVIGALLEGLPALLIFGPILFPIARGAAHRSGALRDRDHRRDGDRVLPAAGRRRLDDRRRHRAARTSTRSRGPTCRTWWRCSSASRSSRPGPISRWCSRAGSSAIAADRRRCLACVPGLCDRCAISHGTGVRFRLVEPTVPAARPGACPADGPAAPRLRHRVARARRRDAGPDRRAADGAADGRRCDLGRRSASRRTTSRSTCACCARPACSRSRRKAACAATRCPRRSSATPPPAVSSTSGAAASSSTKTAPRMPAAKAARTAQERPPAPEVGCGYAGAGSGSRRRRAAAPTASTHGASTHSAGVYRPGQLEAFREDQRADRRREDGQHLGGALDAPEVRLPERVAPHREEQHRDHPARDARASPRRSRAALASSRAAARRARRHRCPSRWPAGAASASSASASRSRTGRPAR